MRRFARTDSTQIDIVATLRLLGCSVVSLSPIGRGCPDLAVAVACKTYLVELKDGSKSWKLTPDQERFILMWEAEIPVLESVEDAQYFVKAVRGNRLAAWLGDKIAGRS